MLSDNDFQKQLLQEKVDEEQIKQKIETKLLTVTEELVKISKKTLTDNDSCMTAKKLIQNGFQKLKHNLERVTGVFVTVKYYRALVTLAISYYMETGWFTYFIFQSLPLLSMICGVYLVSNIGNPSRLTLRASVKSGLIGEALFGVTKILFGTGSHWLTCVVCTSVAIYYWQWPTNSESVKRSNKYSSCAVAFCVCVIMMLVWGSIIMNTTIEVDDDQITISEALYNVYNSPAWPQMKMGIWDAMMLCFEGNWDEAGEILFRLFDLSGTERALLVLGLPRDADKAAIKARYKELAREWHPDKYQGDDKEAAYKKFVKIQQAYTLFTKRIKA